MKLPLTLLLLFVAFGINAQKQLQPYNYTITKDNKTETLMIYASAEAVNSITFTLKNEKNETLKSRNEKGEEKDITFKVFPFTEVSFRKNLVDAIISINEKDEENKEYGIFIETLDPLNKSEEEIKKLSTKQKVELQSERKDAVQGVRNIYQFFNALVITAFQYDTEPVAGILKYKQSVIIENQSINNFNTEDYFNDQAEFLANYIDKYKDDKEGFSNKLSREKDLIDNEFMSFLSDEIIIKNKDDRIFFNYEESLKNEIAHLNSTKPDFLNSEIILEKEARLNLSNKKNQVTEKDSLPKENNISKLYSNYLKIKRYLYNYQRNSYLISTLTNEIEQELKNIKTNNLEVSENDKSTINFLNNELIWIRGAIDRGERKKGNILTDIIIHENSYLMSLFDYFQNIKNSKKAKPILKNQISIKLKEWYGAFKLKSFTNDDFANNYFKEKYRKTLSEEISQEYALLISSLEQEIVNIQNKEKENKKSIDSLSALIAKNEDEIKDTYIKKNKEARESYLVPKWNSLLKMKDSLSNGVKDKLEESIDKKEGEISELKKLKKPFDEKIKSYQNKINFLLAEKKDQIIDVPWWQFDISNIEIDFNDGFIEHITVNGKVTQPDIDKIAILNSIKERHENYYADVNLSKAFEDFYKEPYVKEIFKDLIDKELKFDNDHPIGFSSKNDFADLNEYFLYSFKGSEKKFSLRLTDVIKLYVQRHQNDRLNFSPRDQVVRLPLDDPNNEKQIELKKEKSSKILNAKIFTDFNGLQENKPNGLVQFEVEKMIPIFTKRYAAKGRGNNYGFINYVNFNLTWAKLNEEDRDLQLSKAESFVNNQIQIDNYVTYLDLIRFENVSVGVDANLLSFGIPSFKLRFELNTGIHYGRVNVVDKVTTTDDDNNETTNTVFDENINIIRWYPDIIVRVRPEERFGGYLRYRPFKTIVPNTDNNFFAVSTGEDFENDQTLSKDWLQRFELGAFYTPSAESDNKFFFRYRYTNTFEMDTNGYSEIQVGYQIYLKF